MNETRQIVTLMAFAVAFALVGHTLKNPVAPASSGTAATPPPSTNDVKIILGGGIATVLLCLAATTGEGAAKFAKGLALVTLVSSVLHNGTGVFGAVTKLTGATAKLNATTPAATAVKTTTKAGAK